MGTDLSPLAAADYDEFRAGDLTDAATTQALIAELRPTHVFHLAGIFRGSAGDIYRVNLQASLRLLDVLQRESPDTHVLLVGSAAEYGILPAEAMPLTEDHPCSPISHYGLSKLGVTLAARQLAEEGKLACVVARPFNLTGAGMPTVLVAGAIAARIKEAIAQGGDSIRLGNLDSQRDFVDVADAAEALVRMMQAEAWGQVFHVCSGRGVSVRSLVDIFTSFVPSPIKVVVDPALVRPNDPPIITGDPGKSSRTFGFRVRVPLEESLRQAWDAIPTPKSSRNP